MVLAATTASAQINLSGSGTESDPYLIKTKADWDHFANQISRNRQYNSKFFKLANDIESTVSTTAGSFTNEFSGTFDGGGHTLNVNISGKDVAAPFEYIKGATIKNLHTTGNIILTTDKSRYQIGGGIVGSVQGSGDTNSYIIGCESSVTISSTISGTESLKCGGIVGTDYKVTIRNCVFNGTFTSNGYYGFGGIVGDAGSSSTNCNIESCLFNGSVNISNSSYATSWFYLGPSEATGKDNYYIPSTKNAPKSATTIGKAVTTEWLKSGEMAWLLNNGVSDKVWGQTIGTDDSPVFTTDAKKRVYKASFKYGDKEFATAYANNGIAFTVPTIDGYTAIYNNAVASNDIDIPLLKNDAEGYALIGSKTDWDTFANNYGGTGNYRLTANIGDSTNPVTTMVGSQANPFKGTFDGGGYTLTIKYTASSGDIGPFRYINGATIKNLHTTGEINKTEGETGAGGGIAGRSVGNESHIYNSYSSVILKCKYYRKNVMLGGFVGMIDKNAKLSIENCIFDGTIEPSSGQKYTGGFVGGYDSPFNVSISNSLMAGSLETSSSVSNNTFMGIPTDSKLNQPKLKNCYWISEKVTKTKEEALQGIEISSEVAKSGELAFLLQGNQTEQHWGQAVGTDDLPQLTNDASKRVIENKYDDGSKAYNNYVVIDEDKGNKAIITANANASSNVKLVRTFADGWNTLVLPFNVTTDEVKAAFGDNAQVAYFTNSKANTIELNTKKETKDIKANEPVLIKPSKTDITSLIFNGKTIENVTEPIVSGDKGINFVGSYDASYTIAEGQYFISGTNLWRSAGKTTIKGTRAYFTVPSGSTAKPRLFIADGSTTGIMDVKSDAFGLNDSSVYNLSGQKVGDSLNGLPKGIYIVGGKKVIKR